MEMIINILLIVLVMIFAWIKYKQYIAHKYRYRFLALRDKLREKVMEGAIKKFWYFDYLDFVLSKQSEELESITIWQVIGIGIRRKHSKDVEHFKTRLNSAFEANKEFESIYKEYANTLSQFFLRKHFITFIFVTIAGIPVIGSVILANSYTQRAKKFVKNNINELIESQEETIPNFC